MQKKGPDCTPSIPNLYPKLAWSKPEPLQHWCQHRLKHVIENIILKNMSLFVENSHLLTVVSTFLLINYSWELVQNIRWRMPLHWNYTSVNDLPGGRCALVNTVCFSWKKHQQITLMKYNLTWLKPQAVKSTCMQMYDYVIYSMFNIVHGPFTNKINSITCRLKIKAMLCVCVFIKTLYFTTADRKVMFCSSQSHWVYRNIVENLS